MILFSIRVPGIVLAESTLSFLGFGIPPPFPSWGGMLSGAGRQYMFRAPWLAIWPGVALAAVTAGVLIDRYSFYALGAQLSTAAEIARIESIIREVSRG